MPRSGNNVEFSTVIFDEIRVSIAKGPLDLGSSSFRSESVFFPSISPSQNRVMEERESARHFPSWKSGKGRWFINSYPDRKHTYSAHALSFKFPHQYPRKINSGPYENTRRHTYYSHTKSDNIQTFAKSWSNFPPAFRLMAKKKNAEPQPLTHGWSFPSVSTQQITGKKMTPGTTRMHV